MATATWRPRWCSSRRHADEVPRRSPRRTLPVSPSCPLMVAPALLIVVASPARTRGRARSTSAGGDGAPSRSRPHRATAALGERTRAELAAARDAALAAVAGQVRVPGHDEPRDPHAHERRHRHDRAAAGHRRSTPSSASTPRRSARSGEALLADHQRHPGLLQDRGRASSSSRQIDFDLARRAVEDVVELLARAAQAKGLELAVDWSDPSVPDRACAATPGGSARSCINLVGNAVKFTAAGRGRRAGAASTSAPPTHGAGPLRGARHRHRHRAGRRPRACSSRSRRPTPRPPASSAAPASGLAICKRLVELMGGDDRRRQRARPGQHVLVHRPLQSRSGSRRARFRRPTSCTFRSRASWSSTTTPPTARSSTPAAGLGNDRRHRRRRSRGTRPPCGMPHIAGRRTTSACSTSGCRRWTDCAGPSHQRRPGDLGRAAGAHDAPAPTSRYDEADSAGIACALTKPVLMSRLHDHPGRGRGCGHRVVATRRGGPAQPRPGCSSSRTVRSTRSSRSGS